MTENTPLRVARGIAAAQKAFSQEGYAFRMGYDCALNGANDTNCHFAIFSSPEQTKEWERGKAAGEIARHGRADL